MTKNTTDATLPILGPPISARPNAGSLRLMSRSATARTKAIENNRTLNPRAPAGTLNCESCKRIKKYMMSKFTFLEFGSISYIYTKSAMRSQAFSNKSK